MRLKGLLYIVAGCGLIAGNAYLQTVSLGGFWSSSGPMPTLNAILLGIAGVAILDATEHGHRNLMVVIVLGLLCGEAYVLTTTAQRTAQAQVAQRAPLDEVAAKIARADKKLAEAKAAKPEKADRATYEQKHADVIQARTALTQNAGGKNCIKNCSDAAGRQTSTRHSPPRGWNRSMLMLPIRRRRRNSDQAVRAAQAERDTLPATAQTATAFSDDMGLPQWAMDIIASLAASIALTWPASALIALGERMMFRRRRREPVVESVAPAPLTEPQAAIEAKPMPERIQIKAKAPRNRRQKQKALPCSADLEVAKFGKDRVILDQRAAAEMSDIKAVFAEWAHGQEAHATGSERNGRRL